MVELTDMLEAVHEDERDKYKAEHTLLAWQTALLMNSTGNYKKAITVEQLVGKPEENKESNGEVKRLDREEKK